jgi:hypothetical protein
MLIPYTIKPILAQALKNLNFPDIFIFRKQNLVEVQEYLPSTLSVSGEEVPARGLPKSGNSALVDHFMQKLVALDSEADIATALAYLKNYLTSAKKIDKLKEKIAELDLQLKIGIVLSLIAYPAGAGLYFILSLTLTSAIFPLFASLLLATALIAPFAILSLASYAIITRCFSAWSANKETINLHEQENQLDTWLAQTPCKSVASSDSSESFTPAVPPGPSATTSTSRQNNATQNSPSSVANNPYLFLAATTSASNSERNTENRANENSAPFQSFTLSLPLT